MAVLWWRAVVSVLSHVWEWYAGEKKLNPEEAQYSATKATKGMLVSGTFFKKTREDLCAVHLHRITASITDTIRV